MPVKHAFSSAKADGADSTLVRPSNWNADHLIDTLLLSADISPTSLAADVNDWAPTGLATASVIRITSTADRIITGLTGGSDGRVMLLFNANTSDFDIRIPHDSASSVAANRFETPADNTFELPKRCGTLIWYDSTISRWRILAPATFSAGAGAPIGTAATGVSSFVPRVDHVHPTGATVPSTQAFNDAATVGTGPAAAMTDHKHGMPVDPTVDLAVSQTLAVSGDITPPQLTANVNDYSPSGFVDAAVLRLSSDTNRDITGLAGGVDGRIVMLMNVGGSRIVLRSESTSSVAANRLSLGGDQPLDVAESLRFWYDATSSRWRPLLINAKVHQSDRHSDAERLLYFEAAEGLRADGTTIVALGTAPAAIYVRQCPDAAANGVQFPIVAPADYVDATAIGVEVIYAVSGAAAANVRCRLNWSVLELGDTVSEAGTDILFTQAVLLETNVLRVTTRQNFTPTGLTAGDMLRLWFHRLGADGLDTYTGNFYIQAVKVYYTSGG
jgi:hypothetical protein